MSVLRGRRPSAATAALQDIDDVDIEMSSRPGWSCDMFQRHSLPILGRAIQTAIILALLISISLTLQYADKPPVDNPNKAAFDFRVNVSELPTEPWDPKFEWNVVLETHSHSSKSDGAMDPHVLVEWALAYGFDALIVSDHNTIKGAKRARRYVEQHHRDEIVVIPAVEYSCCRIHMNLIGIDKTIAPYSAWPSDFEIREAIDKTHEMGGVVIVNHIPWSLETLYDYKTPRLQRHPSRQELLEWGVDGFTCVQEDVLDLATVRFSEKHGLALLAASDVHHPLQVPRSWTVMKVEGKITRKKILGKIKKGETSFLVLPQGPFERASVPMNGAYDVWAPLLALDFRFLYEESSGTYSFSRPSFCHESVFEFFKGRGGWMVFWSVAGFVVYEVVRGVACLIWRLWREKDQEGVIRLGEYEEVYSEGND